MKRILLAGATLLALTAAQPTLAADAPVYKGPAPVAAALFNWSGFYVGVDAGYLWSRTSLFNAGGLDITARPDPSGFSLGGHLGYRMQFASALVLGLEADIAWLNASGRQPFDLIPTAFGNLNLKWNASLRGTLGFAANRALFYATAGAAWINYNGCSSGTGACFPATSFDSTPTGWTAGGGLAYAFTDSLIGRVEYLYADYGTQNLSTPGAGFGTTVVTVRTHTARGGLSWRF